MQEALANQVGREVDVLVDSAVAETGRGRLWSQAPEIDGGVWLKGAARVGQFSRARILGARDVDLEAEVIA